jgi:uncharacterized protein YkwD
METIQVVATPSAAEPFRQTHKVAMRKNPRISMFRQSKIKVIILLLVLMATWLSSPLVTLAQSETAYDLVNAVNDLRALHGLEPYRVDPTLMAYAQKHSEYQAKTQQSTHIHSDGTLPQSIGLQENVAAGDVGVVTVAVVVYEIWVDWGHRHILVGYSTGDIGAGIAYSKNAQAYYTVDIRPGQEAKTITPEATSPSYAPLETSTPSKDCSIIHVVGYGQSLWSIAQAYGVTINTIRDLNNLASDSTIIQIGQNLLIQPACTPTLPVPTQTLTDTPSPIAEATQSTATEIPSPTMTSFSPYTELKEKGVGSGEILAIGIFGLLGAALFGLMTAHKNKTKSRPK